VDRKALIATGGDPVDAVLGRRALLRRGLGAAGALALGAPGLASCGSSGSSGSKSAAAKGFGTLTYRLSWVENVEFAGAYIADSRGYYTAEHFSGCSLLPGGPSATAMEADVVTKKAIVAISSPDITAAAVAKGAPLKIIGAQFQKNPIAVMSMASRPILEPQDLYGKRIGVQATNEALWNSFLVSAKLDPSRITKVPVQFDPTPLTQGTVDGWLAFVTNEPIQLQLKGFQVKTMLVADHGYPMVAEIYIVRTDTIAGQRDMLKAFLRAEIKGWTDNLRDPSLGANLAVNTYGRNLGLSANEQLLESQGQNRLMHNADTKANGIFTVSDTLLQQNIAVLKTGGVDVRADLFDLSLLKEVYQEDPSLISALPAVPPAAS
jgi:ABC-type nitrate/sulfonate/bicarbonate transport system substrate-binding protein